MSEMTPIIAIVGRPNVGKSTLFNRLTQSTQALVLDVPGVTRDRQYGEGQLGDRAYFVVDTSGLEESNQAEMVCLMEEQTRLAIEEADAIYFMVDAKDGLVLLDTLIAERLRRAQKPVTLLVNKADRESAAMVCADFHALGLGHPWAISAKRGRGVAALILETLAAFPVDCDRSEKMDDRIRVAVIGRPNVGKSTLVNRLLGETRMLVFDQPGTTRDSITVLREREGKHYAFVDTAGIRPSSKISSLVERFSMIKAMQAMRTAQVVIAMLDAQVGLTEQDQRLLGIVTSHGKALVIAFNKWDGMTVDDREQFKTSVSRDLSFVSFARRYTLSALHGTGVGRLYPAIQEAYASTTKVMLTSQLTRTLKQASVAHPPPLVGGRRPRLRYAHLGGRDPLLVVIHGQHLSHLSAAYQRYLSHCFRETFKLQGVSVLLKLQDNRSS